MNRIVTVIACLVIVGCQPEPASEAAGAAEADTLAAILDAQPDEAKARYPYRHPKETIEFFGIEPGMTVVEALPGGGWYTEVLAPAMHRLWERWGWVGFGLLAGAAAAVIARKGRNRSRVGRTRRIFSKRSSSRKRSRRARRAKSRRARRS